MVGRPRHTDLLADGAGRRCGRDDGDVVERFDQGALGHDRQSARGTGPFWPEAPRQVAPSQARSPLNRIASSRSCTRLKLGSLPRHRKIAQSLAIWTRKYRGSNCSVRNLIVCAIVPRGKLSA